jgi:hypothetical protein
MSLTGVNLIAVAVSAVAGFLFGGLWYGTLSKQWMAAVGLTEEKLKAKRPSAVPFLLSFAGMLVIGFVMAMLLQAQGLGGAANGAAFGALVAVGFTVSTLVVNHAFQGAPGALTLIDGGHWLGVFAIQGAVLGWFGAG